MKQHLVRISLGLVLMLAMIGYAAKYYPIPFIQQLEFIAYDARLRLTMPNGIDDRIVILDIDEKSLAEEGRWPWQRNKLGALLDKLFDKYGAAIAGFDVVFAEKDESSGLGVLQELGKTTLRDSPQFQSALTQLRPQLEYDQVFANAMKNRPVILGYYFNQSTTVESSGVLPHPVLAAGTFAGKKIDFLSPGGFGGNLLELQNASAGAGHFLPDVDEDGVSRRVPMLVELKGAYYEPLSLAIVRTILGNPKVEPGYPTERIWSRNYSGLEWLQIGPRKIPVDEKVSALVPYRGREGSFKYLSVVDVLKDRINPEELKDKIVLIGTSAPGLLDLRSTPVAKAYPGVEIHANLIAGILDGKIKQKPPYVLGAEVVGLLIVGLLLAILLPLLNPVKSGILTLTTLIGVIGLNLAIWHYGDLVLPVASGVLLILGLFTLNMSYGFLVESRGKRLITGLFGQYVPPELVDEMAKNPENFSMEGESRELSVLFSDVRGFTTISEGLDPKDLRLLMNEFLTPLSRIIYKYRGTIDKYMGDCIMAFWGAPVADAEHARNAVMAGLEMQAAIKSLAPRFKERGWPEIKIGVGINTGRMSVGNMGSEIRLAYTVMGDAVNLASRLEGITKRYGADIIVGETTKNRMSDFVFLELDKVQVKGKDEPVAIYEPIGPVGQVDKAILNEISLFNQALKFYRTKNWDMAELQLFNLQKTAPEKVLYSEYLRRIKEFRVNPPSETWNGVYVFDSK